MCTGWRQAALFTHKRCCCCNKQSSVRLSATSFSCPILWQRVWFFQFPSQRGHSSFLRKILEIMAPLRMFNLLRDRASSKPHPLQSSESELLSLRWSLHQSPGHPPKCSDLPSRFFSHCSNPTPNCCASSKFHPRARSRIRTGNATSFWFNNHRGIGIGPL
jgi:hypothetical protein